MGSWARFARCHASRPPEQEERRAHHPQSVEGGQGEDENGHQRGEVSHCVLDVEDETADQEDGPRGAPSR